MITGRVPHVAFLLLTRVTAWLRLSQREEVPKTAEILILRHQLVVLQRRQPRRPHLTWAGRALLAALLSVIPEAKRQGLRLLVTPDTVLRWHRDIARRRQAVSARPGRSGRPATRRNTKALAVRLAKKNPGGGYRRIHGELAAWESTSRRRPYGRSSMPTAPAPRRDGPSQPGHSSCTPRPGQSWPAPSSARTCPAAPGPMS
jgi:hypothetical protein